MSEVAEESYLGGEDWMEEFYVLADFERFTSVLRHQHCENWEGQADRMNLRDLLQTAYFHLEECDGK